MMFQRLGPVRLAALSCALVSMPGSVLAISDGSTSPCNTRFIADGDCDLVNDTEQCEYDGGDCCECTCVSTEAFTCGENGGYSCLDPSAPCADDDSVTTLPILEEDCVDGFVSDGDCDLINNTGQCGYDGGDCCSCTCVSTEEFTCGDETNGGFACIDPLAQCTDEDDFMPAPSDNAEGSFSFSPCLEGAIGNADCDPANNNEECGYDGGDCCECDCVSTADVTCGDDVHGGFNCINPDSLCVNDYVDAGTKTTVGVSANAFDARPGQHSGDLGCMVEGCLPALARDGDVDDMESRWSCARTIVPAGGGACEISFTFMDPQDIKDVQVSFCRKDIRPRKFEVTINGEDIGTFDSFSASTFISLGMEADNVSTLSLSPVGIDDDEWINLLEVLFLVEP